MAAHRSPIGIVVENGSGCHDACARTRMRFLQKLFSPLGYIEAVILASLGLAPVNATQWLASHISSEAISWVSSEKGAVGLSGCWSAYFPWDGCCRDLCWK